VAPSGPFRITVHGNRAIAKSGSVDWVVCGSSWQPGQEIVLRDDGGGFGAGSQFSWQAIGTHNWLVGVTHGIRVGLVGRLFAGFRQIQIRI
jgi:hypothetical protein